MIRMMEPNTTAGVVIIARNEGDRLHRCLDSVLEEIPAERVVYVDSGSTDGSVEHATALGVDVVELDTETPFTAARARNAGWQRLIERNPNVNQIQFMDGDCELRAGWLSNARQYLQLHPEYAVACGRRRERSPDASFYNRLIDLEWATPSGTAKSCGGDALFRRKAIESVGGFDDSIIAGEEPELCVRIRHKGWKVVRLDHEMTLHDADLTHFSQWWRRSTRYGHAAFEGFHRHGGAPEHFMRRQCWGILLWGGLAAWIAIAASVFLWPWGLLTWLIYPAQLVRQTLRFRRDGATWRFAGRRALTQLACKPAELIGGLRFWLNRLTRRSSQLIEYKAPSPTRGDALSENRPTASAACAPETSIRSVAYFVPTYPELSETFVWREAEELQRSGRRVLTVALRAARRPAHAVSRPDVLVYETAWMKRSTAILVWFARNPVRSMRVLAMGVQDACFPGERTSFRDRMKCLIQSASSLSIASRLVERRVQHLHAHFAHSSSSIAMYTAVAMGVPWTFTGHANDLFQRRHLLLRKLQRANGVACISQWHAEFYRSLCRNAEPRLRLVRCGVDVPHPSPSENAPDQQGVFRVLSVGRFVEKKGFDGLIRAFAETIKTVSTPMRLTLVGDGPLRDELVDLAKRLGLDDEVVFTGALAHSGVGQELDAADCFILACCEDTCGDRDGIPVVLMEAMARGLPTLAGNMESIRELIDHQSSGFLVDADDVMAISQALQFTIENPSLARRWGREGRLHVEREFSTAVNLERLCDLFQLAHSGRSLR
ncbi:MAG: glycosyltransferase [Planctomycetota bacterium]